MNNQTIYKESRENEPRTLNETGRFLESICKAAKDAVIVYPKLSSKVVKGVSKDVVNKSTLVRSATADRIQSLINESQYKTSPSLDREKLTHFAGLNMYGTAADISWFLAKNLSPDQSHFYTDACQIGIAAALSGLIQIQSDFIISESNFNKTGEVKVFKAFRLYAEATNDQEKMYALEVFYKDFVVDIFNVARDSIARILFDSLTQSGVNAVSYNSVDHTRKMLLKHLFDQFPMIQTEFSKLFESTTAFDRFDRAAWMSVKSTPKQKSDANTISLIELPRIARDKGVLTEVVVVLPPRYRAEENGVTVYKGISLSPSEAYKLSYLYGISYKAAKLDSSQGELVEGGKRRTKILTHSETLTKITKQFTKYFEPGKDNKPSNIRSLADRSKYIDITDANISQGTGLQLTSSTAQTVFLFPEIIPDQVTDPSVFVSRPDILLKLIFSSLGYAASSSAKCPHDRVMGIVTELYKIFNMPVPGAIHLNTVPKKGGTGNAFSSMMSVPSYGTQQMYSAQPTYNSQQMYSSPTTQYLPVSNVAGGEI